MKVLRVFIIILIIFMCMANISFVRAVEEPADESVDIDSDDIIGGAEDFLKAGEDMDTPMDEEDFRTVSNVMYNILLIIGIIAAVITGLIIAVKIITGSATQKAETKELLIPYVVGCIIVFGAFGIWKIAVNILNQTQE